MFKYFIQLFQRILVFLRIRQIQKTILVFGIDNSGKSTFLMRLGMEWNNYNHKRRLPFEQVNVIQNHFNINFISPISYFENRLNCKKVRDQMAEAAGSVILVDGKDHERLPESKQLIQDILLQTKRPVLIFYNKCDREEFGPVEKIDYALDMEHVKQICQHSNIPIHVQVCSIVKRCGIKEGLQWLYDQVGAY